MFDPTCPRKKAIPEVIWSRYIGVIRKSKVVLKLAISPVAASQSGTGCAYVPRPVWSRLFSVSSRVPEVRLRFASPVQFINRLRSAGLWGVVKLRLKENELARRKWMAADIKKQ